MWVHTPRDCDLPPYNQWFEEAEKEEAQNAPEDMAAQPTVGNPGKRSDPKGPQHCYHIAIQPARVPESRGRCVKPKGVRGHSTVDGTRWEALCKTQLTKAAFGATPPPSSERGLCKVCSSRNIGMQAILGRAASSAFYRTANCQAKSNNNKHTRCDTQCRREDIVSERLRRWPRNPLGFPHRGSNPIGVAV